MTRPRVAIIGGGVSGSLSAARLAEQGFEVVLLEKAAIGNGSSSRSMAGIRAQFGVEEAVIGMLFAEWWYTHFHDLLATPEAARQPVMRQNGYLFLYDAPDGAETAAAWQAAQHLAAMQRRLGAPVALLSPAEIGRRWPHLRTDHLAGATWCPTDGFLFPPVIYGEAVRRASDLGACIVQRAEVLGARRSGDRIVAVETSRGTFEVDWVVNCTNAWAPRVSHCLGGMPLPIEPTKRFLYHLRPLAFSAAWQDLPMTIYGMGRPLGAHTRPDGHHLILAGKGPVAPEPDFSDEDQDRVPLAFDHRHGVDNFGFTLLAEMARYAPDLAESGGLVATTCGYYGMTPDGVPLIGRDRRLSNLVHAAGFSGHGLMHAPVTALLVSAILSGRARNGRVQLPPPFDMHHLQLARFDPARDFSAAPAESAIL